MPTGKNLVPPTTRKTGLIGSAGGDVRGDNVAWSGGPPAVSPISLGDNTERAANFHPTTDYETEAPLGTSVFTDSASKTDIPVPTVVTLKGPSSDGDLLVTWTTPDSATIPIQVVLLTQNEFGDYVPIGSYEQASNANTHTMTISGLTNGQDYKVDVRRGGDTAGQDWEEGAWGPFAARSTAVTPTV